MMPFFTGVVFDADGTLFDTESLMCQVWDEVGQELHFLQPAHDYLDFVGLNRVAIDDLMAQRYGTSFDSHDFMNRCSTRLQQRIEQDGVPLKDGARAILQLLSDRGIPTALATSTHRIRTDARLRASGLAPYFRAIVTGDEVTHGKPHPEIYQTACRLLGTSPEHTLAVEDSRNGILSAHRAGMPVVMIPDLISPTPDLEPLLLWKFDSLIQLQKQLLSYQ